MILNYSDLRVDVLGAATALPQGPAVSNIDLLKIHPDTKGKPQAFYEEMSERIFSQFGFKERFFSRFPGTKATPDEPTTESLIFEACKKALGGKAPSAFVLGTTTSRRYTGSQATAVLGKLQIEAPAFEIKAGCSTSLVSLQFAQALLMQGYPDVLVACGETLSKLIHPEIRETWFGLADGAAAIWFKRSDSGKLKFKKIFYSTDGRAVDLYTTHGNLPPTAEAINEGGYYLQGNGPELMTHALKRYSQVIDALEPKNQKWIVPHQVNRKLINEVISNKNLSGEIVWDADRIGNLGGSSILYSLAHGIEMGKFSSKGELLAMSVGGGLTFAGQIWEWL